MKTVTKGNEGAEQGALAVVSRNLKLRAGNLAAAIAGRMPLALWHHAALACYAKIPSLSECTLESQALAWNSSAVLGQVPGIDVHWLPFKNGKTGQKEVVSVTDYKDIVRKAMDSAMVTDLFAEVVYAEDEFEVIRGTDAKIIHKPKLDGPRGEKDIVAFYMVAQMKDSPRPHFDVMLNAEVKRIQHISKAGDKPDGPWINHYVEMGKKTILKRGCKTLPRNLFPLEYLQRLQEEDDVEFGRRVEARVVDQPPAKPPKATPAQAPKAPAGPDPAALRHELKTLCAQMDAESSEKLMFECAIEDLNACMDVEKLQKAIQTAKDAQG